MGIPKLSILSVCLMVALQLACAQNSPDDFLKAHNAGRAQVGVPPLAWNEKLVAFAQDYAKKRSGDCAMKHSDGPYGENLAAGSWDVNAKEAVQMWLDEKKFYDGFEFLHWRGNVWALHTGGLARLDPCWVR
ncbi:UNVERIFIED_CONTAM: Basic form of pathogenesis-related protein 1 [Sesamum radiatum]|uniref:Basic form of pathogenesis-related protein 1 n=1 Tax=Sesamum radiatum TaxID=300843 RepID=A0AAW2U759_SESRA